VVGPTGIGKSKLALHFPKTIKSEIVSADSRQIYRFMDIGTAKPTREELSLVPHHLINIANPDDNYSLAQYQTSAYRAIKQIHQRNTLPILVGGSGMYVWSVLEGWEIPQVPPDLEFRDYLKKKAAKIGNDKLYQELVKIDPVAAKKIDPHNTRRIIRALEVYKVSKTPASRLQHKKEPAFQTLIIGLTTDRAELYRRIDTRVDKMIKQGLVAEVEKIVDMGYNLNLPAMSGIGYKQIGMFLNGELTLAAAIQKIKFETHRFVRHQYSWFRLSDKRIHWFDIQSEPYSEITKLLAKFREKQQN
jgi:tRNA dimethylallyltransferase